MPCTIYKSFDVETTGLNAYRGAKIFAYCIGHEDGTVDVFRLDGKKEEAAANRFHLEMFFADTSIGKIAHNAKFEMSFLHCEGINVPEETEWHDTMIMSQLFRNLAPSHALDYLCWELAGMDRTLDVEVQKMGRAYGGYQNVPKNIMHEYQINDGLRTMLLFQLWFPLIQKEDFWKDYQNEIKLLPVIERMQHHGIDLCTQETDKLIKWLEDELEKVQNETYQQFNEYINLNSPDAVMRLLYKRLKLPVLEYTDDGKPSTGKDPLLKLRKTHPHPFYIRSLSED